MDLVGTSILLYIHSHFYHLRPTSACICRDLDHDLHKGL